MKALAAFEGPRMPECDLRLPAGFGYSSRAWVAVVGDGSPDRVVEEPSAGASWSADDPRVEG